MISLDRASYQVQPRYAEYAGLSTDIKPVEVDNGDEFQEINTGFVYKFDETNGEWVKQPTGGGGGAIDDNTISTGTTWSSRMIVDSLAPSFEISGPVVTCNPVPGYPLSVVSQIVPVQEGEGDPSPENVRPISGWDSATLTHNDTPITLPFGQTVYGGTLDWTTGVLTVDWATTTFTGEENWYYGQITNMFSTAPESELPFSTDTPLCNQFIGKYPIPTTSTNRFGIYSQTNNRHAIGYKPAAGDIQAFKDFLRTRYEDGNPVVVAHKTLDVFTIQLTPQEIIALSGVNTIYTDTGDTTVSGRADPTTIINQLAARIAALESAATNI